MIRKLIEADVCSFECDRFEGAVGVLIRPRDPALNAYQVTLPARVMLAVALALASECATEAEIPTPRESANGAAPAPPAE